MAGEYLIQWTDDQNGTNPLKPRFTILPNAVNGPGFSETNSPLHLPGRYVVNYGEFIAENFIHLLENFCGPTEPVQPTPGMTWFDNSAGSNGTLKVRDKTNTKWILSGSGGGAYEEVPRVGGPGTASSDFNATVGSLYFINTSSRVVTATLPSTASVGDMIVFVDEAGTWNSNQFVVNNNGHLIMGLNEPLNNNIQYSAFKLVYSGTMFGWRIGA